MIIAAPFLLNPGDEGGSVFFPSVKNLNNNLTCETVDYVSVSSHLDFYNPLYSDVRLKSITHHQFIQNTDST